MPVVRLRIVEESIGCERCSRRIEYWHRVARSRSADDRTGLRRANPQRVAADSSSLFNRHEIRVAIRWRRCCLRREGIGPAVNSDGEFLVIFQQTGGPMKKLLLAGTSAAAIAVASAAGAADLAPMYKGPVVAPPVAFS